MPQFNSADLLSSANCRTALEELHHFVVSVWARSSHQPIHPRVLVSYLQQRVPSTEVEPMIAMALERCYLAKTDNGSYLPRPKHEWEDL